MYRLPVEVFVFVFTVIGHFLVFHFAPFVSFVSRFGPFSVGVLEVTFGLPGQAYLSAFVALPVIRQDGPLGCSRFC